MGILLYTQETLLNFIGALHSYLHYTIIMSNPTNLHEVCVQDMHIESKGKSVHYFYSTESIQSKQGKEKGKGKHATTMIKGDDRSTCLHCQNKGEKEEMCWVLHPELKPKWFKDQKGKQKATIIVEDLG